VNIGGGIRQLVSEEHLNILLDQEDLVMIGKEKEPYRRLMTIHLRASFQNDRFIRRV
jgi:hypothetical protein